jgi:hypothetical protein
VEHERGAQVSSREEAERVLQQAKAQEEAAARDCNYWRGRMQSYTGGMTPAQLTTELHGPYSEAMAHTDRTRRDREAAERAVASGLDSDMAESVRGQQESARRHQDTESRIRGLREVFNSPAGRVITSNPTLSAAEQMNRIEQLMDKRGERS